MVGSGRILGDWIRPSIGGVRGAILSGKCQRAEILDRATSDNICCPLTTQVYFIAPARYRLGEYVIATGTGARGDDNRLCN
jgi:hypothetical protein